jgi:hypothetical protein
MVVYNTTAYAWDWYCHLVGGSASLGIWPLEELNQEKHADIPFTGSKTLFE